MPIRDKRRLKRAIEPDPARTTGTAETRPAEAGILPARATAGRPTTPRTTAATPRAAPARPTPATGRAATDAKPRTAKPRPRAEPQPEPPGPAPSRSPLQDRVDPFGRLFAKTGRGLFMGNRGGQFHDPATRQLTTRRWIGKAWICCQTSFQDRHRAVWSDGYTELFFLDEVTALAAGHRPCFECRRQQALAFAKAWAKGNGQEGLPSARVIDSVLHEERLNGRDKRSHVAFVDTLPDGAVIAGGGGDPTAFAIKGAYALPWSAEGWGPPIARPRRMLITLLTPPSIVMALEAGYRPVWHPSAFERPAVLHQGAITGRTAPQFAL